MKKKKLISISILALVIVLSTLVGYKLITGKGNSKGKVKEEKVKDGKVTDKVKEKQKEKQKGKVTSDNIMDFDLLTGWLKEEAKKPEFNSYIYDGSSKSDFPEGAKDNVYPDINPPYLGQQKIEFRHLNLGKEESNLNASFFTSSEKTYEVGTMRGAFIKRGLIWGDEAGVWCQPVKMLDGVLLEVLEPGDKNPWILNDSRTFTNRMASVEMEFKKNDLTVKRIDFAPEGQYGFFYLVELKNEGQSNKEFTFRFTFQENIRPIWHKPWTTNYGKDIIEEKHLGLFTAYDVEMRNLAEQNKVGKENRSDIGNIEIAFGSVNAPDKQYTDRSNPYRNRGILEYRIKLEPGEIKKLEFLSVMHDSKKMQSHEELRNIVSSLDYFDVLKGKCFELLSSKEKIYAENILGGPKIEIPDKSIENGFYSAKYNMQALKMDLMPFYKYRNIMTCPERAYQKSFGIDSMYASIGAAYSGFKDIVRDTLQNFYYFSEEIDYEGTTVEISQFGVSDGTGRAQEGTQYIGTLWEYLKLTGDTELLKKMYPGLKKIHESYMKRDKNNNFWPEGMTFPGLSERVEAVAGKDQEMISAAVRMWWATKALGEMAEELGEKSDSSKYLSLANEMKKKFNDEWWMESRNLWAIGLSTSENKERQVFLDYKTAPFNYPQQYGIADYDKGQKHIESVWHSDAVDSRNSYYGSAPTVWQNSNFAMGCFNYQKGEYGLKLLQSSAACAAELKNKMLGAFSTINPDPANDPGDNENKIMYSWSAGPYLESVIKGLFGVQANDFKNIITFKPYVPESWERMSLSDFMMGSSILDFTYENKQWKVKYKTGQETIILNAVVDGKEKNLYLKPGDEISLR
jgi:hypothetical protein